MEDRLQKWRLILGASSDPAQGQPLAGEALKLDEVLEALYDSDRQGGLGPSAPNVSRWLGDIRRYFTAPVVRLLQKDALERLGLEEMLLEPELLEAIEPDIELVATLLQLKELLPDKTKATARQLVRQLVEQIERRLRRALTESVRGALQRHLRNRRPRFNEIDWHRTIRANLRHYQEAYRSIIPEQLYGFGRKGPQLKHVILLVDQSASMSTSVVYAGVIGSILASLRSLRTHLILFDTSVVDLTEKAADPVDLLFAAQLGGGTDIARALTYAQQLIQRPSDTTLFLLSDLYEGGLVSSLLERVDSIRTSGAQLVSLLALNDEGAPAFDREVAGEFARRDLPAFACSPDQFPELLAAVLQGQDLRQWLGKSGIAVKN